MSGQLVQQTGAQTSELAGGSARVRDRLAALGPLASEAQVLRAPHAPGAGSSGGAQADAEVPEYLQLAEPALAPAYFAPPALP